MLRLPQNADLAIAYLKQERLANAAGSWLDYRRSVLTKRVIVNHYPPALMIEPTNICNLKCPLCPSGNGSLKRERGMMDPALFQSIVDSVHHKVGMLILWNQGEPYLNPEFNRMVRYAADKGLYTMCSTNASLSLDATAIIQSGLSKLIISMDGISKATYDQYRVNGDYDLVLQNMKSLVEAKRALRSATPQIVWQFIIMRQNEHEIDSVKRLAHEIGVDKLEFKTVQIYSTDDLRFLPADHELSRYSAEGKDFQLKTKLLNRCRRLWTQPVINWDGELSICCYDKDLQFRIGNITELSFSDLWFGTAMNKMRRQILHGRDRYAICRNCGEGIVQKLSI
jgi:MoaA/NifB/PqqE/SkfB family radical SAM enzyme